MLIRHKSSKPIVDPSSFVAPTAVLVGNVIVGKDSRVMYGAVLDSEGSRVEIGECTILCEYAVLRATSSGHRDLAVFIGNNSFIGPRATLIGCIVQSRAYIATGATILQGAVIHSGAIIGVNALVHANAVIPQGYFVPPQTVAIGDPVKIYWADERNEMVEAIKSVGFPETAFGINAQPDDRSMLTKWATEVRSKEFAEHANDVILNK